MELPTDSKVSVLTYKSFTELNGRAAARAIFQRLVQLAMEATLREGVAYEVRVVAISSRAVVLIDDLLIVAPATKEQLLHEIIRRGLQAVANNKKQEGS